MLTNLYIFHNLPSVNWEVMMAGAMKTGDEQDLVHQWEVLVGQMVSQEEGVARGRMMSADALTYGGKVFVFFSTKGGITGLGCRVGRETNMGVFGLESWQHLAPFKTKPPMKDWIVAGGRDVARWADLATYSLEKAKEYKAKENRAKKPI